MSLVQAEFVVVELVQKRKHGEKSAQNSENACACDNTTIASICVCAAAGESHWSSLLAQPVFRPLSLSHLSLSACSYTTALIVIELLVVEEVMRSIC